MKAMWEGRPIVKIMGVVAAAVVLMLTYRGLHGNRVERSMGWEVKYPARLQDAEAGILDPGESPPEYVAYLIQPASHSPITSRPGETHEVVVKVEIMDADALHAAIPPPRASVQIHLNGTTVLESPLRADEMHGATYTYSGEIQSPDEPGEYEIVVETEYRLSMEGNSTPQEVGDEEINPEPISITNFESHSDQISVTGSLQVNQLSVGDNPLRKVLKGPALHVQR